MTMSMIQTATVSARPMSINGLPAKARTVLFERGVVRTFVPIDAPMKTLKTEDGDVLYLRISLNYPGGRIPCYVHIESREEGIRLRKSEVNADVVVYVRTHVDDSQALHIDLHPTDDEPTHTLLAFGVSERHRTDPTWKILDLIQDPNGLLAIAPVGATLAPIPKAPVPPPRPLSADPQLDRYQADGWTVKEDRGHEVLLVKAVKGIEKSLIYRRPKPKDKKRR